MRQDQVPFSSHAPPEFPTSSQVTAFPLNEEVGPLFGRQFPSIDDIEFDA